MKQPRIVITGMGAVTPLGIGVETYWKNLIAGKSGIGPITRFDTTDFPVQLAAEVRDFSPQEHGIPGKFASRMALFTQYACAAANEAILDSGYQVEPLRCGLVLGTALGGTAEIGEERAVYEEKESRRVSPAYVPKILANIAAAQISIAHQIRGCSYTLSTACASGDDAVGLCAMLLRSGAADAMLAVGCEAVTDPVVISSLASAHVMVTGTEVGNNCPFDSRRSGFVLGEGGGALLLETEEHAKKRGARIYGELLGYGNNNDAFHITSPREGGDGGAECIRLALASAGLQPQDIDYINAHGTATGMGDAVEYQAVAQVFGDLAKKIPMSSLKGATGHMMAAGSITETIACLLSIRDGILPPTLHYQSPDPACPIDCVPNQARKARVQIAMNNAFGFGGQNASLIFGQYTE